MPAGLLLVIWAVFLMDTVWGPNGFDKSTGKWFIAALFHIPYLVILCFLSCGLAERIGYFWKGRAPETPGRVPEKFPVVCIQLPTFNEHAVARREIEEERRSSGRVTA